MKDTDEPLAYTEEWPPPCDPKLRARFMRALDAEDTALRRLHRTAIAARYLRALMLRDKGAMARAVADLKALDTEPSLELQSTDKEKP